MKTIIEMAREAGLYTKCEVHSAVPFDQLLEAFAALVRADQAQGEEHMSNQPIAWHYPGGKPDQCTTDKAYAEKDPAWTPMYYKHEWVGLTDEECMDAYDPFMGNIERARAIEAKLKEKNT